MLEKFQRRYKLTIYPQQWVDGTDHLVSTADVEQVEISDPFTLNFSIRKAILSTSNVGNFKIYNLSQQTRNTIYRDFTNLSVMRRVVLQAGYFDPLPVVFDGNMMWSYSSRAEGSVDFISEIQAWDLGSYGQRESDSQFTQQNATRQSTVSQLVSDMNRYGTKTGYIGTLKEYLTLNRKRSVNGSTWRALMDETGGSCFIDNGRIHILQDNEYFTGDVEEISSSTGLLGSPKKSESYVQIEMLFEPKLLLGQGVLLISESQGVFSGQYKVVGLTHAGTISGAVGGKCKTTVSLLSFDKNAELVNG
jgi:hypothetical protein